MYKLVPTFIIILGSVFAGLGQDPAVSGIIFDIDGTGVLEGPNKKKSNLTEKDYVRILVPTQVLKAGEKGKISIYLCGEKREIRHENPLKVLKCPSGTVPPWLKKFFTAGIKPVSRGPDDFILIPIESIKEKNTIRPETAMFRWAPVNKKLRIRLSVKDKDNVRFEQNDIDGREASFTSAGLRKFLENIQEKYPESEIELAIMTDTTRNIAVFELLSKDREISLQRELEVLKTETKIFQHIGRAQIFNSYGLYIEMADEYEAALEFSPESLDLLRVAASAEDYAGNFEKKGKLEDRIQELEAKNKKNSP